ncbi:MAG: bile acid:sodium symporter [Fuerstiella sp.]|nr:bile acid:sodium symporter [Fuerstiella sp.]
MPNSIFLTIRKNWFLVGLVILIPLALVLASLKPPAWFITAADSVPTSVCTAVILFLMSVTLNSRRLFDSLRKPLPVLTACGVNQLIIPLLCFPMLALQKSADLRVGLLIAASVPCTMAAASVWTRRAAGNDAVSLLVTLITNGLCFLITPLWLLAGSTWYGTADASGSLHFGSMVWRLILAALLPAFVGQMVRLSQPMEKFVDTNKPAFSNIAQGVILMLVFVSAFRGGIQFGATELSSNLRHQEFATVWVCCVVLHLAAMFVVWHVTGLFGFPEEDRRACVFAGSQKTLPIGILVSQATGLPFSILPMLMYHMSQLFIDTWIADGLRSRTTQLRT